MFNDALGLTEVVLEGRKTMTRRFVPKGYDLTLTQSNLDFIRYYSNYQIGDTLAVAQKYRDIMPYLADSFRQPSTDYMKNKPGYGNKLFVRADLMPHQIRITNVRVERLQDISDEDCLREGIVTSNCKPYFNGYAYDWCYDLNNDILASQWYKTPKEAFAALIDKISGKGTWDKTPWVFVYEFKLVK